MSVSVLLPTYKRPQGLRQAVESVLAQTRMPDELIIIDNSPEGDAAPIARNAAAVARFDVVYVHGTGTGRSQCPQCWTGCRQTSLYRIPRR